MDFLNREKITELELSGQFILYIIEEAESKWSGIVRDINVSNEDDFSISDNNFSAFEFALALIAIQFLTISNLLTYEQAIRIKKHIFYILLSTPEYGDYSRDTIKEYMNASVQSLKQGLPPYESIASLLYDKLECQSNVNMMGKEYQNPFILMALSEKIVTIGGAWWKTMIQKYEIVE